MDIPPYGSYKYLYIRPEPDTVCTVFIFLAPRIIDLHIEDPLE
jgi:hypothetical protein